MAIGLKESAFIYENWISYENAYNGTHLYFYIHWFTTDSFITSVYYNSLHKEKQSLTEIETFIKTKSLGGCTYADHVISRCFYSCCVLVPNLYRLFQKLTIFKILQYCAPKTVSYKILIMSPFQPFVNYIFGSTSTTLVFYHLTVILWDYNLLYLLFDKQQTVAWSSLPCRLSFFNRR